MKIAHIITQTATLSAVYERGGLVGKDDRDWKVFSWGTKGTESDVDGKVF